MSTEVLSSKFLGRATATFFAAFALSAPAPLLAQTTSYIPPIATSVSTTLFSSGTTAISPGRVAVDKAGNTFFINHVAPFSLYEIPAASPAVTNTAPLVLITGLGQYNSNAVFVDPNGNLWISNGNGSDTVAGSTEYIGLLEVPAANGIPNTAALAANTTVTSLAATNCSPTNTLPCVFQDNTFATNLTNYYVQPSDLFVDGAGNVYLIDVYDGNSSGMYNRVLKFSAAAPGTGTLIADNLTSNANATLAVDAAGNVFYNDSSTGGGKGTVSRITAGVLTPVGTTATLSAATIASVAGISADLYGNLFIAGTPASGATGSQLSEVPYEATGLNFADEFVVATGLANTIVSGGFLDSNGTFSYASATNIQQLQIGGYNFGSVPVGTNVTASSAVPAPTLNLFFNAPAASVASYFPTASPTANTLPQYLQSFPYSGSKSFAGTSFTAGQTGTLVMNFEPIHPGSLKGSFTPRSGGVNDAVINLQGVGVGPQALFLPGIASSLFASANASATSATATPLKTPLGLAVDTYGDIFVADSGNGKVTADCLSTTTVTNAGNGSIANSFCANPGYTGVTLELGTSFLTPAAIALDGANNLYVVDSAANTVTEINGVTTTATTLVAATATFGGTPIKGAKGIAVDGYSNVYLADTGNSRIVEAHQFGAAATQNIVLISATTIFGGTPLSKPQGLAFDSAKNLFIADTGNNRIVEYSATGVASVLTSTGISLAAPTALVILPSGTLVVTDSSNNVSLLPKGTGSALPIGTLAPAAPQGLALDLAGNIYIADTAGNRVLELNTSSPTLATFGTVAQGTASATVTTTVRNSGNATLTLAAAPTLDSGDTAFKVLSGGTCAASTSLTPAAACTVQNSFTPNTAGPVAGTTTLTDNQLAYTLVSTTSSETAAFAANGTQAIALTGTGQAGSGTTAQTITFSAPASPVLYSGQTIPLSATSTSGLTVSFSVTSGPASVTGNGLTLTGAGTVVLAAGQGGNNTYAPATPVSQSIIVNPGPQTITFPAPASPVVYSTAPIALSATASSGQPVTFTVTSGPATVSGSTLTLTGAGTVVIAANQAGNSNYNAAPTVSQSITATPAAQTINFTPPPSPVAFSSGTITLTATSSSGLNPTFTVTSGPATVSGSTLTLTGAGTVIIAANQAGSANYNAAPAVSQSITVTPAAQTISFTAPATPVTFNVAGPVTLVATATSGLPVSFSVISGPAIVSGSTLTFTGVGTVIVAANQAGNANYNAAPAVSQTITVTAQPATATPVFNPVAGSILSGKTVGITSTTTGAVIYYTTNGTTPTTASTLYTTALVLTASETVEAIAVAPGYAVSAVATAVYTVPPIGFTFSINPATVTVTAGLSNTATVAVTPLNNFSGTVSFACSGLPTGATCSFAPATIVGSSTAPYTTLTVSAPAGSAELQPNKPFFFPKAASGAAFALALCLLGFKKRRRLQLFSVLALSLVGFTLLTGCSEVNVPPSYVFTTTSVTVTATSGSLTSTQTFTLQVQ